MSKTPTDQALFKAAEAIRARAYAPYSKFLVGAAILADDGKIYAGCNIENAAYPQGNCAEASAIAAMIAGGAKRITRIYVTGPGKAPVTPCGGCRQRIREFAELNVTVISHGVEGEPLICTLEQLLPHSFGPEFWEMSKALKTIRKIAGSEPIAAALVLGSGLSAIGDQLADKLTIPYSELKGFPGGSVSGHGRDLLIGRMGGKRIAILTGREHYYEHGNAAAMRPALETMSELGAQTLLLTNSAGSVDEKFRPGDLMLIADHINYAGINPLIGEPTDRRFTNMVDCYAPDLRAKAKGLAEKLDIRLNEGVYLWYSGPSFETVAEIQMAIRLGATAVGMSTAPEVILGRFLGLKVWACSSITNMGAGLSNETISHEHTKTMAVDGAEKLKKLIPALVEEL